MSDNKPFSYMFFHIHLKENLDNVFYLEFKNLNFEKDFYVYYNFFSLDCTFERSIANKVDDSLMILIFNYMKNKK